METGILNPVALTVPHCTNAATTLDGEMGTFVYCELNDKLGFVTSSGVSGELVTSA